MGNHRFRLSDMMPNSWFYKLKDMSRVSRNKSINSVKKGNCNSTTLISSPKLQHDYIPNRSSYYLPSRQRTEKQMPHSPINTKASDTQFPADSPVKNKPKTKRNTANSSAKSVSSALSNRCNCPAGSYKVTSSETDIIFNVVAESSSTMYRRFQDLETIPEMKLPPILTKPMKKEAKGAEFCNLKGVTECPNIKEKRPVARIRRRLVSKKIQAYRNQQVVQQKTTGKFLDSFVVVKSSLDPQRDFRDSMLEMIVENNIRASSDLEELLACYLSLNCKDYHEVIIKAFKQIWFDLNHNRT